MVCLAPPAARRMSTELFRGWEKLAQTPESLDALRRVQPSAPLLTWPLCRVWSSCGGGLLVLEAASGEQLFTGPGPLYAQKRLLLGAGEAWLSPPLAPTPGAIPTRCRDGCPPGSSGPGTSGLASNSPGRVAGGLAPGWTAFVAPEVKGKEPPGVGQRLGGVLLSVAAALPPSSHGHPLPGPRWAPSCRLLSLVVLGGPCRRLPSCAP